MEWNWVQWNGLGAIAIDWGQPQWIGTQHLHLSCDRCDDRSRKGYFQMQCVFLFCHRMHRSNLAALWRPAFTSIGPRPNLCHSLKRVQPRTMTIYILIFTHACFFCLSEQRHLYTSFFFLYIYIYVYILLLYIYIYIYICIYAEFKIVSHLRLLRAPGKSFKSS